MTSLSPSKPHQSHSQLIAVLKERGMIIPNEDRAKRKLTQIGYYRLSGFWYPCREFKTEPNGDIIREDFFQKNINFNDIIKLYLFDKKLRLLMMDAIERIEIHIRSVIAHELGYHDPLAYESNSFIQPGRCKNWTDNNGKIRNHWREWVESHKQKIKYSREECIAHHKSNLMAIPFWVVIEAWDFGTMSKYFENLNPSYQNKVCQRLDIPKPYILKQWLQEINILRNRCAHHTRIWNKSFRNPLPIINNPYFNSLTLDERALKRMYGMICVLWFLVQKIGPSSDWLNNIRNLMNYKPAIDSCPNTAMGFPDNRGFPVF
jgi:abortive infection bacteriophage resistance protein